MNDIESQILKYRQQAQFGGMSYVYIVLFIFSIMSTVVSFQETNWILVLVSLMLGGFFLNLMFNIHGVDIDITQKIVITYKEVLWFRISKRYRLNEFRKISITRKMLSIKTSRNASHASDTYHYYYLNLVGESRKQTLMLAESEDYWEIVRAADVLSLQLNMEIQDEILVNR